MPINTFVCSLNDLSDEYNTSSYLAQTMADIDTYEPTFVPAPDSVKSAGSTAAVDPKSVSISTDAYGTVRLSGDPDLIAKISERIKERSTTGSQAKSSPPAAAEKPKQPAEEPPKVDTSA